MDCEGLVNISVSEYSELDATYEAFEPYYRFGTAAIEFRHSEDEWLNGPLGQLVAPELEQVVDEQFKESLKMPEALAEEKPPHRRGSAP